jgi:hypothetical protein
VSVTGTTPLALTRFGYALGVWEVCVCGGVGVGGSPLHWGSGTGIYRPGPYHADRLFLTCHPLSLPAQAHPSFNWVLAYCGEVKRVLTQATPRELATLAWVLHR